MGFTCVGFLFVFQCLTPGDAKPAVVDTLVHAREVHLPADWRADCLDEATGTLDMELRLRDPAKWQACANIAGNNKIIKTRRAEKLATPTPGVSKKSQQIMRETIPKVQRSAADSAGDMTTKPATLIRKVNYKPRT